MGSPPLPELIVSPRPLLLLFLALLLPGARAADAPLAFTDATIPELQAALEAGTLDAERLVTLGLARIEAFDRAGPELGAVLTVNPRAR